MKKQWMIGTVAMAAAALMLSACGNSEANTSKDSKGSQSLVVSTFGLSEDIVKKTLFPLLKKIMMRKSRWK